MASWTAFAISQSQPKRRESDSKLNWFGNFAKSTEQEKFWWQTELISQFRKINWTVEILMGNWTDFAISQNQLDRRNSDSELNWFSEFLKLNWTGEILMANWTDFAISQSQLNRRNSDSKLNWFRNFAISQFRQVNWTVEILMASWTDFAISRSQLNRRNSDSKLNWFRNFEFRKINWTGEILMANWTIFAISRSQLKRRNSDGKLNWFGNLAKSTEQQKFWWQTELISQFRKIKWTGEILMANWTDFGISQNQLNRRNSDSKLNWFCNFAKSTEQKKFW